MKNVSNKFKNIIEKGGPFYAYAKVLFADGTEITLDSEDDFSISDNGYSESGGDDLPLGSALSKTITLSLFNEDGRFSDYDFYYAQITLYTEAELEDGTQERINEGLFYVTSPVATGEIMEITAYDAMYKTNKEFTSQLSYPATARSLLLEVCAFVGITVGDAHFQNEDFQIQSAPEKSTARKIIGYIAQIAVGNAIIKNGSLSIKSYDFEPLKDVTDGTLYTELPEDANYHILSEYTDYPTVGMNSVTITGIRTTKRVDNEDVEYLNGTDDYALSITNPLITGAEENALKLIGDVLSGVTLMSFSGTFFPYPTAEIMDCAVIVDSDDKAYKTVITTHDFTYPGESELSCGIQDPETNSSTYYSESAEMYHKAQADANKNRKEMESAIENLQTTLANAKGMYTSKVRQSDGSYITYLHDKPTMSESENVIKITSDAVGVSTDGGQTYPYGFFLTGDLVAKVLYAIGINADYINTGALTIKDKDGNITFYADTVTGRVDIRAESLAIGGQTLEAIANMAVKKFVDNIYTKDINNLKDDVKNKIETWYQPTDPAVNWGKIVETPWCDVDGNKILDVDGNEILIYFEEDKASHIGDLWKNTTTNEEYRYSESGEWVKMPVPDAVFDEIDGKAQIFINTPSTPYSAGDLWFDSSTSEIMTCVRSRETGSFDSSDWEKRNKYTDDSGLNDFITATYDPIIAQIQARLDGQIENWFYDYEPTLQNYPASEWTTETTRKEHEGDLFYWKSKGYSYRFTQEDATAAWKWQLIQDTDITKALAAAEKAQDTADGKRRVFVVQPKPPYDIGDLWVQGGDGDIMRCKTARSESATFSDADWEKASKYTDDTKANEVKKELDTLGEDLQNQIDGKIETYNQTSNPAGSWTTDELKANHKGDLWYNPDEQQTKRWNGSAWEKLSDADAISANNLAMTKKRVFVATPYPPYDIGDLWVGDNTSDLKRCVTAKKSGESYSTSDWIKAVKYTDDSAVENFINTTYAENIEKIKEQLDQKIETWYQDEDPALSWTAVEYTPWCDINGNKILDVNGNEILLLFESEKSMHEGDLWHTKTGNKEYIYQSGHWVESSIPDEVFDKIDGKASIYVTQPKPPYDVGDTWFTGTDIKVCVTARTSGSFNASDWGKKDNYTDDSTVNDFIQNTYDPKIEDIQNQIDGKIDTYFYDYEPKMNNIPASEWTTDALKTMHNGDLFFWKSKGYTYRFLKIDSVWQWFQIQDADISKAMEEASNAQDTADSKRRVFVTTPVPPYDIGDLWTQGSNGDLMRCKVKKESGTFASTDWEKAVKYTDDSAVDDLNEALTQEDIFKRLTNNGQAQGLFLKNGKIYLNFSYAEGGTLKLGGLNNVNGLLEVYDASGNLIGTLDENGLDISGIFTTKGEGSTITLTNGQVDIRYSDEIFTKISASDNGYGSTFETYGTKNKVWQTFIVNGRKLMSLGQAGSGEFTNPTCYIPFGFYCPDNAYVNCLYLSDSGNGYLTGTSSRVICHTSFNAQGNLSCSGTKNRVVETDEYGKRLLTCYETPAPMFGDVGEGIIGADGKCYIDIDPIFSETIASGCKYQVFLQKNGKGDVWVSERNESYFVVEGTENLNFSWELKARQKDYEYDRIEMYNEEEEEQGIDYEHIGAMEYQDYVNAMEAEV